MISIADIRKNYSLKQLLESDADADPMRQFAKWWEEALEAKIEEANAMTLATASADGLPSARVVLLKSFSEKGFSFFTNYNSFKGRQLEENPRACLVFFWKELERQVRITGLVEKLDAMANDIYFYSRPSESQVGAVTSPQSQHIESKEWLEKRFLQLKQEYEGKKVDRPAHWGGYIVKPVIIEFWQGQPGRLHDRLQYTIKENSPQGEQLGAHPQHAEQVEWNLERLAP